MIMRYLILLLALLAPAKFAGAQSLSELEPVLVPIVATAQAGAFQSVWTTEFRVRHEAPNVNFVLGYDTSDQSVIIPAYTTYRPPLYLRTADEPDGALLYIRRTDSEVSQFALRVRDISRSLISAGVEVPVVKERNLLTGRRALLGVRGSNDFRRRLRIYEPLPSGSRQFHVRVLDERRNLPVYETIVSVRSSTRMLTFGGTSLPMRPASIDVDLDQLYEGVSALDSVTIEISPTEPDRKWWAFVTITNNTTQEVTLVTP